jgi:hypothetical protein
MKNQAITIENTIQELVKNNREQGLKIPIFDPADFTILSAVSSQNIIQGYFISRWEEWKEFYKLDNKLKGNGYILVSENGSVFYIPNWASLERKMSQVNPLDKIAIEIEEIITMKNGETYVKTALSLI